VPVTFRRCSGNVPREHSGNVPGTFIQPDRLGRSACITMGCVTLFVMAERRSGNVSGTFPEPLRKGRSFLFSTRDTPSNGGWLNPQTGGRETPYQNLRHHGTGDKRGIETRFLVTVVPLWDTPRVGRSPAPAARRSSLSFSGRAPRPAASDLFRGHVRWSTCAFVGRRCACPASRDGLRGPSAWRVVGGGMGPNISDGRKEGPRTVRCGALLLQFPLWGGIFSFRSIVFRLAGISPGWYGGPRR